MEGMISKEMTGIQKSYLALSSNHLSIERWMTGSITKFLEVIHGKWLYRNVHVPNSISGTTATLRKEEIQMEIKKQKELGTDSLEEGDKYLLEINLEELESISGKKKQYWLLTLRTARESSRLRAHNITWPSEGITYRRAMKTLT